MQIPYGCIIKTTISRGSMFISGSKLLINSPYRICRLSPIVFYGQPDPSSWNCQINICHREFSKDELIEFKMNKPHILNGKLNRK